MSKLNTINHFTISILLAIRPLLGNANCRYAIGCTQFAIINLETKRFDIAIKDIISRLIRCTFGI